MLPGSRLSCTPCVAPPGRVGVREQVKRVASPHPAILMRLDEGKRTSGAGEIDEAQGFEDAQIHDVLW